MGKKGENRVYQCSAKLEKGENFSGVKDFPPLLCSLFRYTWPVDQAFNPISISTVYIKSTPEDNQQNDRLSVERQGTSGSQHHLHVVTRTSRPGSF